MVNMHFLLKSKQWQKTSVSCQRGSSRRSERHRLPGPSHLGTFIG